MVFNNLFIIFNNIISLYTVACIQSNFINLYKVIILISLYFVKCISYFKYMLNKFVKCNINFLLVIFIILFRI